MNAQLISVADRQIATLKREQSIAKTTRTELESIDPDTPTYDAVGRLFVYRTLPTMINVMSEK